MSKKSYVDSVKVGAPCSERWEEMAGNDRVRFCSHCAKSVNNLSTMTRKEAAKFARASDGKICIRYIVDPATRRPVFAEQLLQITRRTPAVAAGALAASLAVSSAAYAQDATPRPQPTPATVEQTTGPVLTGAPPTQAIEALPNGEHPVMMGEMIAVVEYKSKLAQAVADQDKDVIRDLIANGASVNAREDASKRITPMFLAVESGDIEVVQMLLNAGAKVNVRSTSKETPLMRLESEATRELVEILIRSGAKVNVADDDGNTPLLRAAENSTSDAIAALIDAGADVNAANSDGETALMKAASRGDIQSVRALIFAGANVNARDKDGENAWDKTTDHDIEDLLVSYGSEVSNSTPDAVATPEPTPAPTPPSL
ncbi:MAG: ankyrin repeat domain-containing protein [Acidobacteria bacterium]|nr:ankyrin repeat domain-containing protein [Acidobacteriota bacterium]